MTKYIPSIAAAIIGVLGAFSPDVQGYISSHPAVSAAIAGIAAIVTHLMQSPVQK